MASPHPLTPQPSPIEQLLIAAGAFGGLPPDAPKETIEICFDQLRSLLLEVLMGSLDAHPYELSWNRLTNYGDAELHTLMDMPVGSAVYSDKLARIKHLVQSTIELLP